jgi:hypothetical protein
MTRIEAWIQNQKSFALQPISTNWLGIFRIVFFSYLLVICYYRYEYKELLYGELGDFSYSQEAIKIILVIWSISLLGVIIGLFTRFNSIINFLCVLVISDISKQSYIGSYFDDIMKTVSLISIFTPIQNSYAIDKRLFSLKSQTIKLTYITFIICSLGLMYTGSGISKLFSMIWLRGLGIWHPLSLPHISWNQVPEYIVDRKWIMIATNYIIMIWELLFIPLIIWKKSRAITLLLGIVFHLLIAILFFLPQSAIGMIIVYILVLPFIEKKDTQQIPNLAIDISIASRLKTILLIYISLQVYISSKYSYYKFRQGFNYEPNHSIPTRVNKTHLNFNSFIHFSLGINPRNMFTDKALYKKSTLFGVTKVENNSEIWLPWISEMGEFSTDFTIKGGWSKIMQRQFWSKTEIDSTTENQTFSPEGVEIALRFWMKKNNTNNHNNQFKIYKRTCIVPADFEYGYLVKQKTIPWELVGQAQFINDQFSLNLVSEENVY